MIFLFAFFTFISKMAGSLFALRYKDRLHLIMGFSSGVVLGVLLFELLPEVVSLASSLLMDFSLAMVFMAIGFLGYHIAEKTLLLHSCEEGDCEEKAHQHVGIFGASGFSLHSFFDGVAIGLSFATSLSVGIIVAMAVIAHGFTDGLNTTAVLLKNQATKKQMLFFMILNSLAPVLGILLTMIIRLPQEYLVYLLSLFCGFFMYIGAADLLPEAHHKHSSFLTMGLTISGFIFVFLVTRVVG